MNAEQLARRVKQLEIKSKKLFREVLQGVYPSFFKGQGIEFFDVKEYSFEDDIKNIDWNVTARSNVPYVKSYVEERKLQLILVLDISASQDFSTGKRRSKRDLATEISALLAFSALKNGDKVGMLLFSDRIESFFPPKDKEFQVLQMIRKLFLYSSQGRKTDIGLALDYLKKQISKKAMIVLISDFLAETNFQSSFSILAKKHDCLAIRIQDPFEEVIPKIGRIRFHDSETGVKDILNFNQKGFQRKYFFQSQRDSEYLKTLFRSLGINFLNLKTSEPYEGDLVRFFKRRF